MWVQFLRHHQIMVTSINLIRNQKLFPSFIHTTTVDRAASTTHQNLTQGQLIEILFLNRFVQRGDPLRIALYQFTIP